MPECGLAGFEILDVPVRGEIVGKIFDPVPSLGIEKSELRNPDDGAVASPGSRPPVLFQDKLVPFEILAGVDVQHAFARLDRTGEIEIPSVIPFAAVTAADRAAADSKLPIEVIDWGLDVNLRGAIYCCRAVLAGMMERKRGVIINFGSVTGEQGGCGCSLDYAAEKSAMHGLTKSLATLGAPHSVRSCCIVPGPVLTRPGMANMKTLLGRAAEPIEVVNFILYLCSDKASFITGSSHVIDGGRLIMQF